MNEAEILPINSFQHCFKLIKEGKKQKHIISNIKLTLEKKKADTNNIVHENMSHKNEIKKIDRHI